MMALPAPSGLLILDKPCGPTSHDAVAHVRRVLHTRSVGHAGTLDPMATGVLLVLVGMCTKLSSFLTLERKCYRATVKLGVATDTCDAQGRVIAERQLPSGLLDELRSLSAWGPSALDDQSQLGRALQCERDRTLQVPPAHAAIKQDGVAAYKLARRGEQVSLPPRPVHVHGLQVTGVSLEAQTLEVTLDVSKGYYVRAWARDVGETLGVGAHLTVLRRTASGPYGIQNACGWSDGEHAWRQAMIRVEDVARALMETADLTDSGVARALQGQRMSDSDFTRAPGSATAAWFAPDGTLVAIGDRGKQVPTVLRAFPRAQDVC